MKKTKPKLKLDREILRTLRADDLRQVQGGAETAASGQAVCCAIVDNQVN